MAVSALPPTSAPAPTAASAASFITGALDKRSIILGILQPKIQGKFASSLRAIDEFVTYCEELVNLGTQMSVSGIAGKIQITNLDLEATLGDTLFAELKSIAVNGRAFLTAQGYVSKSSVAPAVLLGSGNTSASGYVQSFQTSTPGNVPTNGVKITTFDSPIPAASPATAAATPAATEPPTATA